MAQQLLQNGDQVDKYRVERCLGAGGMGEVYLVSHAYLNVQRAMKILRMELTEDDPTFRDRFVREARIAARFQHPNSIAVVDVESSSDSGFLYLVMEYVNGQSLHQYFQQNGILDEKQMLHICREVAKALDAAWQEMQLVHRDIKPGNIMISSEGEIKLADLGIAKSSGGSGMTMSLTMEGTMIGTPEYASPEQCRDARSVDTRADIYSLGATMYEMLTGVRPFSGANAFDTVAKVLQEPLVGVRQRNPNISKETAALVERMMSKDPSKRPQTMGELVSILDGMLDEVKLSAPVISQEEMLEEVEYLAEKMTQKRVRSALTWQKWGHILRTIFALFVVAIDVFLCYSYVDKSQNGYLDPEVEAEPENTFFWKKTSTPSQIKNNNLMLFDPLLVSTDGKTVLDFLQSYHHACMIPAQIEQFHPNAIDKLKNVRQLTLHAHQAKKLAPFIQNFHNLRYVIVYYEAGQEKPDLALSDRVTVSYVRRYSRRNYFPQRRTAAVPPKTTPVPTTKTEKSPAVPVAVSTATVPTATEASKIVKSGPVTVKQSPRIFLTIPDDFQELPPDLNFGEWKTIRFLSIPARFYSYFAKRFREFEHLEKVTVRFAPGDVISPVREPHFVTRYIFVDGLSLQTLSAQEETKPEKRPSWVANLLKKAGEKMDEVKSVNTATVPSPAISAAEPQRKPDLQNSFSYVKAREEGMVFSRDGRTLLHFRPLKESRECHVPEGVEVIGRHAFSRHRILEKVSLPSTLKTISSGAFNYCIQLSTINLPSGLERIESSAFMGCHNLEHIKLPSGLKYIGSYAFNGCRLRAIYVPASVEHLGQFFVSYIKVRIQIDPANPFWKMDRYGVIYSGDGTTLFRATRDFPKGAHYVVRNSVREISSWAFISKKLETIVLPSHLEKIGQYAFWGCTNLQLEIPSSVTEIGMNALSRVKSVKVEKRCRNYFSDPVGAVYERKTRKLIYFPNSQNLITEYSPLRGTKVICRQVFENNRIIREITLPPSVERIEWRAFAGCSKLRKINIPDRTKLIGNYAFQGCFDLKKVDLPQNTKIAPRTFEPTTKIHRISQGVHNPLH